MRHHASEILAQARAGLAGEGARLFQSAVEVVRAFRQPEGFELRRSARRVFADQYEVARVGHQHQPVAAPIAAYLLALSGEPGVIANGLHLDHAALRHLPLARPTLLHLLRRIQAEVGMPRAQVGQLADAEHLRLERRADGVEQVAERPVARPLAGRAARGAHLPEIGEVRFHRRRQPGACPGHRLPILHPKPVFGSPY